MLHIYFFIRVIIPRDNFKHNERHLTPTPRSHMQRNTFEDFFQGPFVLGTFCIFSFFSGVFFRGIFTWKCFPGFSFMGLLSWDFFPWDFIPGTFFHETFVLVIFGTYVSWEFSPGKFFHGILSTAFSHKTFVLELCFRGLSQGGFFGDFFPNNFFLENFFEGLFSMGR